MNRQPDAAELRKRRTERFHKSFFWMDSGLSSSCLVMSLIMAGRPCGMSFFAFYALLYLGQAAQHYFCFRMPTMDVVSHDKMFKRYLFAVSAI
jgi:hypothetical protein